MRDRSLYFFTWRAVDAAARPPMPRCLSWLRRALLVCSVARCGAESSLAPSSLRWRRLSVVRAREPIVHEIDEINASPGRLLGVIGPSGAGKTTLLRALAGAMDARRTHVYGELGGREMPSMKDGTVAFLAQASKASLLEPPLFLIQSLSRTTTIPAQSSHTHAARSPSAVFSHTRAKLNSSRTCDTLTT